MSGEEMGREATAGQPFTHQPDRPGQPDLSEQRGLAAWLPRRLAEANPSILVVGDLILDGWWSGPSDRMCREAPAPVVDINRREFSPGGAANTAMNLASLGARVSVAGLIGTDDAGTELMRQLLAAGVDTRFLTQDPEMVTTTKIRISSGGQVLLRFDDAAAMIPESASSALAAAVTAAVEAPDAVVICDYGTGALDEPVRNRLTEALSRRGPDQLIEQAPFLRYVPFLYASALTGQRARKLLDLILEVADAREARVATSEVTRVLEALIEASNPPQKPGEEIKLLYASQIGTAPPTIAIVTNRPDDVPPSYERYLVHGFRKAWPFSGSPLRIRFTSRGSKRK